MTHIVSRKAYVAVFASLMVLTAVTVAAAYVDLGPMNTVVALAIAGLKTALVVLIFMHVRYSSGLISLTILAGVLWLALMIGLTWTDVASRNWIASVEYEDRGPLFRADAGFLPRVDTRSVQAIGQRRFWGGEDDWYSQVNVGLLVERVEDAAGDLTDEELDVFANFSGPLQSFAEISLERNRQRFGNVLFDDLERVQLFFQFQPSGLLRFETFVDRGDVIDFFNVQRAEQLLIAPGIEIKPGRHLNAQLDYTRQTLDVPGGELFDASITELRTVYQFNVRAFLRAILQLRRTERDLELFGFCVADPADCPFAPEEERLFTQLLFSYKLNPQTVIFLGYTDNRADVFPDPGGPPLTSSGLEQTNRFFFLKLGYAWLL